MISWKSLTGTLRLALSDLRLNEQQEFQNDVNLDTIAAELKVHIANRLADTGFASRASAQHRDAHLKVSFQLNTNHNGDTKTSPVSGNIAVDEGELVRPALVVHDPDSALHNLIAIELRDVICSSRFKEILRCKQKLLSYVGRPLKYRFGLYLQFRQDGQLSEAKLIRRKTLLERGEEDQMCLLQELAVLYGELARSSRAGIVNRAKQQVSVIEELIGFEDVRDALDGDKPTQKGDDAQPRLFE